MKKTSKTTKRADDAPLTSKELATARPLRSAFPDLAAYARTRAAKGQKTKQPVSIRLSPEVISYFKGKGAGWQTRIDYVLKSFVESHVKSPRTKA